MLLGAACYLGFLSLVFPSLGRVDESLQLLVPGAWILLLMIVAVLAIVDSVRKAHAGKTRQLASDLLVVKLAAIPFFLINFTVLTWMGFFGSTIAVFSDAPPLERGGSIVIYVAIAVGLTYLAMLTTSTYGWATIAQLHRDGRIGTHLAVLYRLLLLLFVADVVAGILLYVHSRRGEGGTPAPNPGSPRAWFIQAGTMLLGAVIYGVVIAFSRELSSAYNFYLNFFIVGAWTTLLLVVTALVIVDSIRKVRAGQTQALSTATFVVKLAAIPFFLLNFFVLAVLALGGLAMFIFGGVVFLGAAWIGSGLTILTMLSTSVYAWATIAQLRRERIIGTGLAVLYTILTFGYVTDTATGILLFGHARRRPGLALAIVLVIVGVVLSVPGFVLNDLGDPAGTWFDGLESTLDWLSVIGIVLIVGTIALAIVRWAIVRYRRRAETQPPAELPEKTSELENSDSVAEAGHDPATSRL
jgi:hypothetical protein